MFDHFDLLAPIYDRVIRAGEIEIFVKMLDLPSPGILLDAGGGTGRISSHLDGLVEGVVVTDRSLGMLKKASDKTGLSATQSVSEQLPFNHAAFSRILVVDSLHHFRDQHRAMAEMLRVLEPGGRLVIKEPNLHRWQVKLIALLEKLTLMRSRFYYPTEICRMAQSHGACGSVVAQDPFMAWIIVNK